MTICDMVLLQYTCVNLRRTIHMRIHKITCKHLHLMHVTLMSDACYTCLMFNLSPVCTISQSDIGA